MKLFSLAVILTAISASFTVGCSTTQDKKNDPKTKSETKDEEKYPFLTRPEVRTIWVPDAVEANRFIEGHRVFVIEKNTVWSKDNE